VPYEINPSTGKPKRVDLDFFENSDVLFEKHLFAGNWVNGGAVFHRENFEFNKSTVLVVMEEDEFDVWSSTSLVEEIDAIDNKSKHLKGVSERPWVDCH
jgi:hypothetical protein